MSGAVRSAGAVSIPASVRKTIQNLKEIAGNHSDEEIYAMLKECSMDPNETAQKLLYQDPFHEVKRKRDKRKENVSNKDIVESRSRSGSQGRGGRGGRGNYPLRYISYDAGSGRGSNMSKENGGYQSVNRVNSDSANPPPATSQNSQTKTNVPGTSSLPTTSIGAPVIPNGNSSNVCTPQVQAQVGGWSAAPGNSTMADVLKSNGAQQVQTQLQSATPATSVIVPGQPMLSSQQYITSIISTSVSGVYSSSSDPVLVPSLDTRVSGAVGTIKREVGAQRLNVDQTTGSHDSKSALSNSLNSLQKTQSGISDAADSEAKVSAIENSATVHSFSHDRLVSKSQTVDGDHRLSEMQPQVTNSTSTASSVGRSSGMANHYNVRPQQFVGPQKAVGPNKEWKPKATNQIASTSPGIIGTSTVSTSASEVSRSPSPASNCVMIEDGAAKLHKKLEEMNVHDDQHVIMPNHLQVPEIERTGLSFGSFDASFVVNFGTSYGNDDESEKSSTPLSEESQGTEEAVEEPSSSTNTASVTPHEDYSHHPQESSTTVDDMPSTNDVAVPINPAVASQSDPTKAEVVGPPGPQYSLVQTAPNYPSIGLVTPIMGSQYPSYEHSEPQLRDASRFPNFVQPAYDPSTSFYTPLVRPSSDGDARFSPFLGSATATKYNGNLTILSGQNGPSSQESGNSLVLSNAGPTALATQTAGIVQTTIPMPQQTVPVFRQPTSVHIQHYPPNYIPYHPYISPMYVPSPTMHNFVGNSGFAQLPAGSSYTPAAAGSSYAPAAAGVKYSLPSQYKPGTASGNSPHIGVPAGYGSYTTAPSGYSASPTVTAGNVSVSDDIGGSHYKENNLYIAGQQAEGSGLWFPQQPRDLLGVQANSYYNMQQIPHSQHVTFAHTQGGHAAFSGLYHPTQSGPAPNAHPMLQQTQALGAAVGVVGAQPGVYQQPQRAQLSWPNNY